jgi:Ca2+/H+ antiporter, TMEM165/GDT1 family
MASRYPPLQVLAGAMAAMTVLVGLAVWVGGFLYTYVPHSIIAILAGLVFIALGIYNYLRRETGAADCRGRDGFFQTMLMIFIAEFGDKTQLAVLLLVASFGFPVAVFVGAMAAMLINQLLAVYFGSRFLSRLNPRYLKIGSALLFIMIGLVMIIVEAKPGS